MDAAKNAKEWTARQRTFLEWLALPSWERTPVTQGLFAKEIGVHESTLSDWKRLPGFEDELHSMIRARLGDALPDVVGAFKGEAKKGQFQHQRMYFEMLGWYVPKIAPTDPKGENEYSGGAKDVLLSRLARLAASDPEGSDSGADG